MFNHDTALHKELSFPQVSILCCLLPFGFPSACLRPRDPPKMKGTLLKSRRWAAHHAVHQEAPNQKVTPTWLLQIRLASPTSLLYDAALLRRAGKPRLRREHPALLKTTSCRAGFENGSGGFSIAVAIGFDCVGMRPECTQSPDFGGAPFCLCCRGFPQTTG